MDPEWVQVTLRDALSALADVIDDIENDPAAVEEILGELMPSVYAKLNYAWNTRYSGPSAIDTVDHDELVGWPRDLQL